MLSLKCSYLIILFKTKKRQSQLKDLKVIETNFWPRTRLANFVKGHLVNIFGSMVHKVSITTAKL